jgi:hypothetical protein
MSNTSRVIIFWLPKKCRKPKQVGLATAVGSAATIHDFARMAFDGGGRLFVVEAPTAEFGRQLIRAHQSNNGSDIGAPGMETVLAGGRVVAIGTRACLALAGAADSIRQWDARIAARGRVTCDESRALRGDPFKTWNPRNAFGEGLGES